MGADPELTGPHGVEPALAVYPWVHGGHRQARGPSPTPGLRQPLAILCCAAGDWGVAEALGVTEVWVL